MRGALLLFCVPRVPELHGAGILCCRHHFVSCCSHAWRTAGVPTKRSSIQATRLGGSSRVKSSGTRSFCATCAVSGRRSTPKSSRPYLRFVCFCKGSSRGQILWRSETCVARHALCTGSLQKRQRLRICIVTTRWDPSRAYALWAQPEAAHDSAARGLGTRDVTACLRMC